MNTYKLGNIVKKGLLKRFNKSQISKKHFSFKLLNELCHTYPIVGYTQHHYCCYGEDKCCWIDESTCWYPTKNKKKINQIVYKDLKHSLKRKNTKGFDIYKRNVFIAENDKYIHYCLPLRDVWKEDLFLIFDKTDIL